MNHHTSLNEKGVLADIHAAEDELVLQAVLKISARILGLTSGLLCALVMLVATLWLVFNGGPQVGAHLGLLREFFYGYSVTVPGSIAGAMWGFVTGYLSGWFIACVYNTIALFRVRHSRA
jgi:hypothetical protein